MEWVGLLGRVIELIINDDIHWLMMIGSSSNTNAFLVDGSSILALYTYSITHLVSA
jgi:hypothetical protein